MKKLLGILCAIMLVFGMVGSASALKFSDIVEYPEGTEVSNSLTYDSNFLTYEHDLPAFGGITLVDATMEIKLIYEVVEEEDGEVVTVSKEIEEIHEGYLGDDGAWSWYNTELEGILNVVATWAGDSLSVFVTWDAPVMALQSYTETSEMNNLTFFSSKLDLDIEPVPEPSTILLLGASLLGLVGYNRKRFSKKS